MLNSKETKRLAEEFNDFPVVGIGASAGGLRSLESLFDRMPSDTGMAFVVIQHLSPDFKSLMDEILARHTDMAISIATHGMKVEPNHIYLIPANKELRIVDRKLKLAEFTENIHKPIDIFFRSLAESCGSNCTGVVLSGTGSDGTDGVQVIFRKGGLTIGESIESAEFDGMPRSAAATGCLDYVLPAEEIAPLLVKHAVAPLERLPKSQTVDPNLEGINLIFSLLSMSYDIKFEHYKANTIARRIERRQNLTSCTTVFEYAELCKNDLEELDALYHDLLIGVTRFFRDTEAFNELEETIEAQLENVPLDETYRVWVAGCASGEECYSIGMMILDCMKRKGRKPLLKIFATDVHQRILEFAAKGEYDQENLEFVSKERQQNYFEQLSDGRFRINATLRRHLVFACHNVIQDPPFTRVHMVTCRNMLIYFRQEAQTVSVSSFHFALKKDGILFLGSSETPGELKEEFAVVCRTWRIYSKIRHRPGLIEQTRRVKERVTNTTTPVVTKLQDQSPTFASQRLLDMYDTVLREKIPSGLILDYKQNILHIFGSARKMLQNAQGRFSGNIRSFLTGDAKAVVSAALIRASKEVGTEFTVENISLIESEDSKNYSLSVQAIAGSRVENLIWILQIITRAPSSVRKKVTVTQQEDDVSLLESELSFTRESLNATIEELETSNEELQATNEEMVASNEELQSTNEELHSVNEELHSVNSEFQRKLEELEETTNDLENLLSTSDIGTIFLDRELKIRKFTEVMTNHFDLMPHDLGRSIKRFSAAIEYSNLVEDLQEVVQSGSTMSRMVNDNSGNSMLLKMVPYRSEKEITGVILNVVNNAVGFAVQSNAGFWEWPDVSKDEMVWSSNCYRLLGLEPDEIPATFPNWKDLIHVDDLHKLESIRSKHCSFVKTGRLVVRMKFNRSDYKKFAYRGVIKLSESGKPIQMMGSFELAEEPQALKRSKRLSQTRHPQTLPS